MASKWSHLIRFVNGGTEYFGDAIIPSGKSADDIVELALSGQLHARVIFDEPLTDGKVSTKELLVEELLSPLKKEQVPLIRCIGLNYVKHSVSTLTKTFYWRTCILIACAVDEVGRKPPTYPPLFIKPSTSLADYKQDVLVPKLAQASTDYEGELVSLEFDSGLLFRTPPNDLCQTIVIGKPARNVDEANALDFVAGYVVSNDVSCRQWQTDTAFGPAGGQWCFSKGFDTWAPIGPVVVSPGVLGAADNLDLTTTVNGKTRQSSNTSGLLFGVKALVAFCSQGTTLEPGSLIMSGTPSGVISGMKHKVFLKDGDVVEVRIKGLGRLTHRMRFE